MKQGSQRDNSPINNNETEPTPTPTPTEAYYSKHKWVVLINGSFDSRWSDYKLAEETAAWRSGVVNGDYGTVAKQHPAVLPASADDGAVPW